MIKARHTSFARLTQKDVNAGAARHEMLYAGRMGGARAVFAFCDLSGLDLSGRDLADADFTGAILAFICVVMLARQNAPSTAALPAKSAQQARTGTVSARQIFRRSRQRLDAGARPRRAYQGHQRR